MAVSKRLVRLLIPFALATGWAFLIYWASTMPTPLVIGPDNNGNFLDFLPRKDLIAHAAAYSILTWLLMLSVLPFTLCKPINVLLHRIMPIVIAGVYGFAMEWVQGGIPGRSAEVLDVAADVVGAIIAIAFMTCIWPKAKRAEDSTFD